jgi:hypothetical protein
MKTLRFLSLAAGVAFLFSGCVGPEGPAGPAGADGLNGTNGVANINITVMDIQSSAWLSSTGYYYVVTTDNAITDNTNMDVNATFSALPLGSVSGPWQALPSSDVFANPDQLTYSWTTGTVTFIYDAGSLNVPADVWFNVSVIPPAIYKKYPNVNFKDASQVMQLPEWKAAMKVAKYVTVSAPTTATANKN